MKILRNFTTQFLCVLSVAVVSFSSCDKEKEAKKAELDATKLSSICDSKASVPSAATTKSYDVSDDASPYHVSLLGKISNHNGTYTWVWSVYNPNPGSGKDGSVQDLSHWGLSLGTCVKMEDIVSAGTSTNGYIWKKFTPSYQEDKSQDCYSSPILKFDVGTYGSHKTYYYIIVKKDFTIEKRDAVYKSGSRTGCGVFKICAIGCPKD